MKLYEENGAMAVLLIMPLVSVMFLGVRAGGAAAPFKGWNNYCAHLSVMNESVQLEQAGHAKLQLLPSGYDYFVLDGGWFEDGNGSTCTDDYGRPTPCTDQYPSAAGGDGLAPFVRKLHGMGFKVGAWHIRGVFAGAVRAKKPIKGTNYTLDQIVHAKPANWPSNKTDWNEACNWAQDWLGVDAAHPGAAAYYDSLAELFVGDFGLDFVKFDCSYVDFSAHGLLPGARGMQEIRLFYEAMVRQRTKLSKGAAPPVLSLSPGGVREDITRAEYIVESLPGTMYRTWPDYWGGMPSGQIHMAQQLYNLSIYGANHTWHVPAPARRRVTLGHGHLVQGQRLPIVAQIPPPLGGGTGFGV